jgi:hypothetical protein
MWLPEGLRYRNAHYFADRRWGKSKMSLKIQLEAAARIWDVWWHYRDLRKKPDRSEIKIKE